MTKAMMMMISTFVSRGLYFTLRMDYVRVLYEYFTPREDAFVVTVYRCYYY
jgi:hypothetical protein